MQRITADAVIFDLDGTLVDSEPLACAAVVEVLTSFGFTVDAETIDRRFTGRQDHDIVGLLAAEQQIEVDVAAVVDAIDSLAKLRLATELQPMPGALDLVTSLSVPKAVASNSTPDRILLSLGRVGLLRAFEPHYYSGADVPLGKPAPDVYLLAARRLGVPPERCVAIEDSGFGVAAGKAANMTVIGLAPDEAKGRKLIDAGADQLVDSHVTLRRLLA